MTTTPGFFPLDYYMRPDEITNCIYASNDTSCPYICACTNPDLNQTACENGYVHAATYEQRKDNPNPLLMKCRTDVPSTFTDQHAKDSWTVGCLSGVKGRHKLFNPDQIDEKSCENVRQHSLDVVKPK